MLLDPGAALRAPLLGRARAARLLPRAPAQTRSAEEASHSRPDDPPGLVWVCSCAGWPLLVRIIWWAFRDRSG